MKDTQTIKRLTTELRDEILFMIQTGQTQATIAGELNVSESTISRWLDVYARIRDSPYGNLFGSVNNER